MPGADPGAGPGTGADLTGEQLADLLDLFLGSQDWRTGGTVSNVPAASAGTRGGVFAVTNAIIDADTSNGIFGWAISHVRRAALSLIAPFALENNATGHIPANRVGENPVEGTIPVVAADARSFRFSEPTALAGTTDPVARAAAASANQAAANAQATADSKDDAATWAEEGNPDQIPLDKLANAEAAAVDQQARDAAAAALQAANEAAEAAAENDPYDWAAEGNDALLIPTDKQNFEPIQVQIDEIHEQIAHAQGPITSVVPTIGGGGSSLRYTLPDNLDGVFDVSVRLKARVQVNEFAEHYRPVANL